MALKTIEEQPAIRSSQNRTVLLEGLKEQIAQKEGRLLRERWPSSTLMHGIPQGALVEISGYSKIEWLVSFFKENKALKVLWLESHFTLFPPALDQRGVELDHFVFAEVESSSFFSTIRKALKSQVFDCVVSPNQPWTSDKKSGRSLNQYSSERYLKAMQLLAEKTNSTLFLLSENLQPSWPITLQFEVNRCFLTDQFLIHVKKSKGHSIF